MFNEPLDPATIQASRALAGTDDKAQVNLPAMGLSAEDLVVLGWEIAVP